MDSIDSLPFSVRKPIVRECVEMLKAVAKMHLSDDEISWMTEDMHYSLSPESKPENPYLAESRNGFDFAASRGSARRIERAKLEQAE